MFVKIGWDAEKEGGEIGGTGGNQGHGAPERPHEIQSWPKGGGSFNISLSLIFFVSF